MGRRRAVAARLAAKRLAVPLGINIVKTNRGVSAPAESDDEIIADYMRSVARLKDLGDYLCLNLSCPNTEMGRNFFADPRNTTRLLTAVGGQEWPFSTARGAPVRASHSRTMLSELADARVRPSWEKAQAVYVPPRRPDNDKPSVS